MEDIFLGGRRPRRSRRLAGRLVLGGCLVAALVIGAAFFLRQRTTYPTVGGSVPSQLPAAEGGRLVHGDGSLELAGRVWVLRAQGEPFALGAAHGRLLAERGLTEGAALDMLMGGVRPDGWLSGAMHDLGLRWRQRRRGALPHERLAELSGLAAGLAAVPGSRGVPSYETLVRRQAVLDVGTSTGPLEVPVVSGLAIATGASPTTLEDPSGGRALLGRALWLPALTAPPGEVLVSFLRPAGKQPIATIGWPGQIGALTGVNAAGIAVAANPTRTDDLDPTGAGVPVPIVVRDVLERVSSLDEAISALKEAKVLGAASFLIVDGTSRQWVVVERSPGRTAVVRPKGPVAVGDLPTGSELSKDGAVAALAARSSSGERVARAAELLGKTTADEQGITAILRDRAGRSASGLPLGNANAIDDLGQAHVAILDPATRRIWISEGPGASARLVSFDLRVELGSEPPRPDVADVPADTTLDGPHAERVVAARAELARGTSAWAHGRLAVAQEASERALALAPDLAEAYALTAIVAGRRGDSARARSAWKRYLELQPASRALADQARRRSGQ